MRDCVPKLRVLQSKRQKKRSTMTPKYMAFKVLSLSNALTIIIYGE